MIGLCKTCEHHPFSKKQRIVRLLGIFCVSLFWASLLVTILFHLNIDSIDNAINNNIYIKYIIAAIINGIILSIHSFIIQKIIRCIHRCTRKSKFDIIVWIFNLSLIIASLIVLIIHFKHGLLTELLILFAIQTLIFEIAQFIIIFIHFEKGWRRDKTMMGHLSYHKTPSSLNMQSTKEDYLDETQLHEQQCPYNVTYIDYDKFVTKHPEFDIYKIKKSVISMNEIDSLNQPLLINNTVSLSGVGDETHHKINKKSLIDDCLDDCIDEMDEFSK